MRDIRRTHKAIRGFSRPAMAVISLSLLGTTSGCAGQSQTSPSTPRPEARSPARLPEEFDPEIFREDLLLIEPTFAPTPPISTPTQPEPAVPGKDPTIATLDSESTTVDTQKTSAVPRRMAVYRVQVAALSDEKAAYRLSNLLQAELGVKVVVSAYNGLQAVHAGGVSSPAEAEVLRLRIAEMDGDFADAFVVRDETIAEIDSKVTAVTKVEKSAHTAPVKKELVRKLQVGEAAASDNLLETVNTKRFEPTLELVRTVEWRVLIHQSLNLDEAEAFRRKALKQLGRNDIEINFHEPWYKVEVGHFRDERSAQELVAHVKNRGFSSALRVRGEVLVPRENQ